MHFSNVSSVGVSGRCWTCCEPVELFQFGGGYEGQHKREHPTLLFSHCLRVCSALPVVVLLLLSLSLHALFLLICEQLTQPSPVVPVLRIDCYL